MIEMKKATMTAVMALMAVAAMAQMMNPVHFSSQLKELKGGEAEIVFSATIDPGWHVYSTNLGDDGPISATFNPVKMEGVEKVGKLQPRGKELKQFDKMFDMELYDIDCYLEYGACNDQSCLPPSTCDLKQKGKSLAVEKKAEEDNKKIEEDKKKLEEDKGQMSDTISKPVTSSDSLSASSDITPLWQPVITELRAFGASDNIANHSLLYILLMGFIGGLLAVCMPCIWPIIPMTVSFFLKRSKSDKQKGIRDAMTLPTD